MVHPSSRQRHGQRRITPTRSPVARAPSPAASSGQADADERTWLLGGIRSHGSTPPGRGAPRREYERILALQRVSGNAAVQRLLRVDAPAAPTTGASVLQRWWGDDEEAESDGESPAPFDWVKETAGDVADWAVETAGGTADWAAETGEAVVDAAPAEVGQAIDWVKEHIPGVGVWASGFLVPEAEDDEDPGGFIPPWQQTYSFAPGSIPGYLNSEGDERTADTDWVRDAVGTGVLSADSGLAGAVVVRLIPMSAMVAYWVSTLSGAASAYWRSYKEYQVQERIITDVVTVHEWYGRYRFDPLTWKIAAVDFQGVGQSRPTYTALRYQQRLTDAEGNVLYTHPAGHIPIGLGLDHENLPEHSFGHW
ncbi:MAG: hypothetical protein ACRDJW_19510 [Thermomicrobiales bacterium]